MCKFKKISVLIISLIITAGLLFSVFYRLMSENKKETLNISQNIENEDIKKEDFIYKDGIYLGEAKGYNGTLKVEVYIVAGKIDNIKILSAKEDEPYWSNAKKIIDKILSFQEVNVDTIAGATISSNAIKKAVANALNKALVKHKEEIVVDESKISKKEEVFNTNNKEESKYILKKANEELKEILKYKRIQDGIYYGVGIGYVDKIRVRVNIVNEEIKEIEVVSNKEDEPFWTNAKRVISKLIGKIGKNVDTISGATYSSRGIIEAVNDAIKKAIVTGKINENKNTENNFISKQEPIKEEVIKSDEKNNENKENKESTETIDENLKEFYDERPLKDGEYIGYGNGFHALRGQIKVVSVIKDGKIKEVRVPNEAPEYPDDIVPFREYAVRGVPFWIGDNARINLAKMSVYNEKLNSIFASQNPKITVRELLGEKYVPYLDRVDNSIVLRTETISRATKEYVKDNFKANKMLDAVSGATISANGIAMAIKDSLNKSANDYIVNTKVKEIRVLNPINKVLEIDNKEKFNLNNISVLLTYKDGTKEEVSGKEFKKYGIKVIDESTNKELEDGESLEKYGNYAVVHLKVIEEKSLEYDRISLVKGDYSDDYIKNIHYSLNGKTWYQADGVNLDKKGNVDVTGHKIIAPKTYEYKNILVRLESISKERYEYIPENVAGTSTRIKYSLKDDEKKNPNLPPYIYINIEFNGSKADKIKVAEENGEEVEENQEEVLKEIEVDGSKIGISLDETRYDNTWLNHKMIRPVEIILSDKNASIIREIENLPRGLTFDGLVISGIPSVREDEWDENYYGGNVKEYNLKIKARKEDKILVRNYKWYVSRDRDWDKIPDAEESDSQVGVFNADVDRTPIISDGKKLSVEDYKSKIKNFPENGVSIKVLKDADYTKVGEQAVMLEFVVDGYTKTHKNFIKVDVKRAVEE